MNVIFGVSSPVAPIVSGATRLATDIAIPDFGDLVAAHDLQNGFSGSIGFNLSRLSDPAVRVLAAFGADADNCLRLEIGTDNKLRMILRKSSSDVLTLASADAFTSLGSKHVAFNAVPGSDFSFTATGLTPPAPSASAEALPDMDGALPRLGSLFNTLHLNGFLEYADLRRAA